MPGQLDSAVVRIRNIQGAVVGAGLLLSDRQVLTCAHVVARALNLPDDTQEMPQVEVSLDFPRLGAGCVLSARPIFWFPPSDKGGGDIAVVELTVDLPEGTQPGHLVTADKLWGHKFRAFGFPNGHDNGVWASGELRDLQASGWLQIEDIKGEGYRVESGFSGTPVWDEQLDGVVGIVATAEKRSEIRAAFVIPTPLLVQAWPSLRDRAIPACPYRGLLHFRQEDEQNFFGRETFTPQLVEAVQRKALIAVIGPSGSGKSSVVFAGLLPELARQGGWLVAPFRPGEHPFRALAGALMPLLEPQLSETDRLDEIGKLTNILQHDSLALEETIKRILEKHADADHLTLIVDQFEELYTLCRDNGERQYFLDLLLAVTQPRSDLRTSHSSLVITLRADFVNHALSYRPLADALQHADLKLGPMTRRELQDAIEKPAHRLGVHIDDGLTERILDALNGEPGNLPLLEFALTLLWSKQNGGKLTHTAYEQIGGLQKALANHAEAVYDRLSDVEKMRARRVFTQLVRPGEGTEDTRRLATRAEVGDENWGLITYLASSRLVVTGHNESREGDTLELAHEALIMHWSRLREWVDADREFRVWQERLRLNMHEWEASGNDESLMLRGVRLDVADEWRCRRDDDLGNDEAAFIQASLRLRERELAEREDERKTREHLTERINWIVRTASIILLILVITLGWQWRRSEEQRSIADSRRLAVLSRSHLDDQLDLALLLSLAAYQTANTAEARSSLLAGLQRQPRLLSFLWGSPKSVTSVAFSPDGSIVASGGCRELFSSWCKESEVVLWDAVTHQLLGPPLHGHPDWVWSIAFSPDGKTLASGSSDNTIILWDVMTHKPIGSPLQGEAPVWSVAFSPNGKMLASGGSNGRVILWDVATHQALGAPLQGHTSVVRTLTFSRDGKTLASGGWGGRIVIWDVATREPLWQPLQGHEKAVFDVAFSPDGKVLASVGDDETVRLWDVVTGQLLSSPLQGGMDGVRSVAFSPDGKTLAFSSADTIVLWDVATQRSLGAPLRGGKGRIGSIAFSPDGQILASGGFDQAVVLWSMATDHPLGVSLPRHNDAVESVAFSPDGKTLASTHCGRWGGLSGGTTCDEGEIILWDVATHQRVGNSLRAHINWGLRLAYSPDGKTLASGGTDGKIILWNVETRTPLGSPLTGYEGHVIDLAFSPDGRILASSTNENAVLLWDVMSHQALGDPLRGPSEVLYGVAFSPDGRVLASGSDDSTILLWDVATHQPLGSPLRGHTDWVSDVAFSPDGKTLASGSGDGTVLLWNVATHQPLGSPLHGHTASVTSIAFSHDGKTLATGSSDSTIILWDVEARQALGNPLRGHTWDVQSIAFSPDGKMLASGSRDQTVILWDTAVEEWQTLACHVANRNLSKAEWDQYVGIGIPYRPVCRGLPVEPNASAR